MFAASEVLPNHRGFPNLIFTALWRAIAQRRNASRSLNGGGGNCRRTDSHWQPCGTVGSHIPSNQSAVGFGSVWISDQESRPWSSLQRTRIGVEQIGHSIVCVIRDVAQYPHLQNVIYCGVPLRDEPINAVVENRFWLFGDYRIGPFLASCITR